MTDDREPDLAEEAPSGAPFGEAGTGPGEGDRSDEGPGQGFGATAGEVGDETEVEHSGEELTDDLARAQADVAALTGDLQRLQAEYLNYKRRVDRDRELVRQNATYAVLAPITEVLDTIDRAREHGPLDDGLQAVADQLERIVAGLGLTKFGQAGDPFDPMLHEALSHIGTDSAVSVTTCKVVAKSGYRIGDRVLRAAQVLVVDPAEESLAAAEESLPAAEGSLSAAEGSLPAAEESLAAAEESLADSE